MQTRPTSQKSPMILLLVLVLISLGVYIIVPQVFILIGAFIGGYDLQEIISAMSSAHSNPPIQILLLVVQALAAIVSFVILPLMYLQGYEVGRWSDLGMRPVNGLSLALVIMATLCFMFVNTPFIEWNQAVQFPEPLHSILRHYEDVAEAATKFLTSFYSLPYFLASVVVIAIIPAIGEELLFRGMIQRYGMKIFDNPHVAIWMTAVAFSAFHFQFFGFLPRMLLGALFGYLYYFSGNLWYSIVAHFTNNAFTILMIYLFQLKMTELDIEGTESLPFGVILVFAILGSILMALFAKRRQTNKFEG